MFECIRLIVQSFLADVASLVSRLELHCDFLILFGHNCSEILKQALISLKTDELPEMSNLVTWICNGCSVSGVSGALPSGVWFVLAMTIISSLLVLLISYATLASHRRVLKWQPSRY